MTYNYPYQALEESLVNAYFHRRYDEYLHARRYRNPRLGEFLKELHLTEGRGTGFPTIHAELKKNGSPDSIIEADDEHTYFIIRIRCHPEFVCEELSMDKDGHILPVGEVWTSDVTDDVTDNVTDKFSDGNPTEKRRAGMMHLMRLNNGRHEQNVKMSEQQ